MEHLFTTVVDSVDETQLRDLTVFHYHEPYNAKHAYITEIYAKDYGYGERNYQNVLFIERLSNNAMIVFAVQRLTTAEREDLVPYCQCDYHLKGWFDWSWFHDDPKLCGCVCYPFITAKTQTVLDATIKKRNDSV